MLESGEHLAVIDKVDVYVVDVEVEVAVTVDVDVDNKNSLASLYTGWPTEESRFTLEGASASRSFSKIDLFFFPVQAVVPALA